MAIDILNIEPTVISRDLKGKYILVYGKPKTGKTTLASRFPKNLLIAFEKGYNAIDGIRAIDINKWADFKLVLRQLEKKEAQ
jgi:Holliday junction resolvasome RuvABC ATP-dependent DNA helicase subunit